MYKRIISILLSIISLVLLYGLNYGMMRDPESLMILLFFILTFILFVNRENKGHIYNIITLLFLILSGALILYILLIAIGDVIYYGADSMDYYSLCLLVTTFSTSALIIMNVIDFKKKPNNINLILNVVVTSMIAFVTIKTCFIPIKTNYMEYLNIEFLCGNYIYFAILTSCLLIHYFVNRKKIN